MNKIIDLRSDTVTLPSDEMRQAIANAELGDDVFQEDPTVNELEAKAADLMNKEAAILVPSGTMGNLASILSHCERGTEIVLGNKSHTFLYEGGGISAFQKWRKTRGAQGKLCREHPAKFNSRSNFFLIRSGTHQSVGKRIRK